MDRVAMRSITEMLLTFWPSGSTNRQSMDMSNKVRRFFATRQPVEMQSEQGGQEKPMQAHVDIVQAQALNAARAHDADTVMTLWPRINVAQRLAVAAVATEAYAYPVLSRILPTSPSLIAPIVMTRPTNEDIAKFLWEFPDIDKNKLYESAVRCGGLPLVKQLLPDHDPRENGYWAIKHAGSLQVLVCLVEDPRMDAYPQLVEALFEGIACNFTGTVERILRTKKLNIHADDNGYLMVAIQRGYIAMTDMLIANGADIHVPNSEPVLAMLRSWPQMQHTFMRLFRDGKIDPFAHGCAVFKQAVTSGLVPLVEQILAMPESRSCEPDEHLLAHVLSSPFHEQMIPLVVPHRLCALPAVVVGSTLNSLCIQDSHLQIGALPQRRDLLILSTLLRKSPLLNDELRWQLMVTAATYLGTMCSQRVKDAGHRQWMELLWNAMLSALQRGKSFYWRRNAGNILYRLMFWNFQPGGMPKTIRKSCQYYYIGTAVMRPTDDAITNIIRKIFVAPTKFFLQNDSANKLLSDNTTDTLELGRQAVFRSLVSAGQRAQFRAIHEELVRVAWHPDRMMHWCMAVTD
jgi:hypothetical protein